MNTQRYTIIRILEWLYIAVYAVYFLFVGYQLLLVRPKTPVSTIPVLSTSLLQADTRAIDKRFVLPVGVEYTASASGMFGKSEPFK